MLSTQSNPALPPLDRRDLTIGVLAITATILFACLLILGRQPAPAYADGMSVSGGDYVVAVGSALMADEDYVYVLDVPLERIIAYRFDAQNRQIDIVQGIELGTLRQADPKKDGTQPAPPNPGRRRP